MVCPRCGEKGIIRILLRRTGIKAKLCERCGAYWLKGEKVASSTGHDYYSSGAKEYYIDPQQ